MEIVNEGLPQQVEYQKTITDFMANFVEGDDFSIALFKTQLLFGMTLKSLDSAYRMAIEYFKDEEAIEYFNKERLYFDAIFRSYLERQEKLKNENNPDQT